MCGPQSCSGGQGAFCEYSLGMQWLWFSFRKHLQSSHTLPPGIWDRLSVTFILWYPFKQIPGKNAIQWVLPFYISDAMIPRAAANRLSSSELLFCLKCLTLAFGGCLAQGSWREYLPWEQTWSCSLMMHLIPVGRVIFFFLQSNLLGFLN